MRKALLFTALFSTVAFAQNQEERIRQLEEQIRALQQELQKIKEEQKKAQEVQKEVEAVKEEVRKLRLDIAIPMVEIKSYSGLGPSASKVHFNPKGVSIGGYGELTFTRNSNFNRNSPGNQQGGAKNIADTQRIIIYLGYAFSEKLKFNSELELEHASTSSAHGTGGGYFKAELAYLDYQFRPEFGLRGGLLLMPLGIINEVHEPPTFPTAERPFLERRLIPTTWEEMGIGAYGSVGMVDYRFYITNGLMLKGNGTYSATAPLQSVKQRGARATFDEIGFTGRVDINLPMNIKVGGSFWTGGVQSKGGGDSALGLGRGTKVGSLTMLSPHIWWQHMGFDIRLVGVYTDIKDAKRIGQDLNVNTFPSKQQGYYLQVAYDLFRLFGPENQELYVFGMYEDIDTHKEVPSGFTKPAGHKLKVYNFGISYKPHPLVAIKADYARLNYSKPARDEDEYRLTLSFMF